jgi:predicted ribosome quality control (RQC) complex YloA/Tae2 family protein
MVDGWLISKLPCLHACDVTGRKSSVDQYSVQCVLESYQSEKRVFLSASRSDGTVQICNGRGIVLKRIPMHEVEWNACTLPGHLKCIQIRYKKPQECEILFKAASEASVQRTLKKLSDVKKVTCGSQAQEEDDTEAVAVERNAVDATCQIDLTSESIKNEKEKFTSQIRWLQQEIQEEKSRSAGLQSEVKALRQQIKEIEKSKFSMSQDIVDYQKRMKELEKDSISLTEENAVMSSRYRTSIQDLFALKKRLQVSEEEKSALLDLLTTAHADLHQYNEGSKKDGYRMLGTYHACFETSTIDE